MCWWLSFSGQEVAGGLCRAQAHEVNRLDIVDFYFSRDAKDEPKSIFPISAISQLATNKLAERMENFTTNLNQLARVGGIKSADWS